MAKRLIDANQMLKNIELLARHEDTFRQSVILGVAQIIRDAQTVDAVEVVRCKDCKFSGPYERMDGRTGYCCLHILHSFTYGQTWDRVFNPVKEPDDFCSYGERKEG